MQISRIRLSDKTSRRAAQPAVMLDLVQPGGADGRHLRVGRV
jgi:hypothetical protein